MGEKKFLKMMIKILSNRLCHISKSKLKNPTMPEESDNRTPVEFDNSCFYWMMSTRVMSGRGSVLIRHLIEKENISELAIFGIKIELYPKRLIIPYFSPDMRRIFEGTKWARGYARALLKTRGARVRRLGTRGKRSRHIEINLKLTSPQSPAETPPHDVEARDQVGAH